VDRQGKASLDIEWLGKVFMGNITVIESWNGVVAQVMAEPGKLWCGMDFLTKENK